MGWFFKQSVGDGGSYIKTHILIHFKLWDLPKKNAISRIQYLGTAHSKSTRAFRKIQDLKPELKNKARNVKQQHWEQIYRVLASQPLLPLCGSEWQP